MAKVVFTAGRVSGFKCPDNERQSFIWDATVAGLGLRTTPVGKPAYVRPPGLAAVDRVFLTWCAEQPAYAALLPSKKPAKTKKAHEALGKPNAKSELLQRGQLAAWFATVQELKNPVIAASIHMMLLAGARSGEVLALRWEDVNALSWKV